MSHFSSSVMNVAGRRAIHDVRSGELRQLAARAVGIRNEMAVIGGLAQQGACILLDRRCTLRVGKAITEVGARRFVVSRLSDFCRLARCAFRRKRRQAVMLRSQRALQIWST